MFKKVNTTVKCPVCGGTDIQEAEDVNIIFNEKGWSCKDCYFSVFNPYTHVGNWQRYVVANSWEEGVEKHKKIDKAIKKLTLAERELLGLSYLTFDELKKRMAKIRKQCKI